MKKIKYLILITVCLFITNVKADMGPPVVAEHEVMVTNKSGAICYDNGKKTKEVIPYGTILTINTDVINGYIFVDYKDKSCDVKSSDISSKTQKFNVDGKDVEEITPVRAIILSKNGLNMRKGPAVTFAKIMTIPANATVTLTKRAGSFWYYCEYKGQSGWITGMNGYFGYDGKEILVNSEDVKLYSTYDKKAVIAKIPANTEITDYVNLVGYSSDEPSYYVNYNGTVGYIDEMMYKTDGTGKIKLLKDYDVTDEDGKLIKKITPQELEYTMKTAFGGFYFPDKKIALYLENDEFEYVKKTEVKIKTKGFLGEGIFGEAKEERLKEEEKENEESHEIKNKDTAEPTSIDTKDIIIICLLGGIFLALTALVIIKIMNNKKKNNIYQIEPMEDNNKEV